MKIKKTTSLQEEGCGSSCFLLVQACNASLSRLDGMFIVIVLVMLCCGKMRCDTSMSGVDPELSTPRRTHACASVVVVVVVVPLIA